MRTETSVVFSATRDRSSEIIGRLGSKVTVLGPSNKPGEISGDEPTQCVPDDPAVLDEAAVGLLRCVRGEDAFHDHRQDRGLA